MFLFYCVILLVVGEAVTLCMGSLLKRQMKEWPPSFLSCSLSVMAEQWTPQISVC